MPDARRSLDDLSGQWSQCTACPLGIRRQEVDGGFVFGEGVRGGLLLVGGGPGRFDEYESRPFMSAAGQFLRFILHKANVNDYYLTNAVACRSCAPAFDSIGRPIVYRNKRTGIEEPKINDEPPTPAQIEACRPRLQEQIYITDPVLIVALGAEAAAALTGRPATIGKDHGTFQEIEIPGVWSNPVLTDKKRQWIRKIGGQMVAPVSQNQVRYLMMKTVHPAFALRFVKDINNKNNFTNFVLDMEKAINTYNHYIEQIASVKIPDTSLDMQEVEHYARSLQETAK